MPWTGTRPDERLKIGILTFHRCINYGSYWQGRCLAEGLRDAGHEVVILDHASRRIDIAEWRCAFRPTLPDLPVPRDRGCYRQKVRRFFRAFESLPLSQRFQLDAPASAERCDAVVVGSDEVWNLSHPWYGRSSLFYGDGLPGRRLISYAASFGSHNVGYGLEPAWADMLRGFECISVRDPSSRNIVEDAIGIRPPLVLDPCLQFPVVPDQPEGDMLQRPYLVVYGHGFSEAFAMQVRRWADRNGLLVVSVGYRNEWSDRQWIGAGPHEFAHCMAGAQAVATNFFHGCIFALRNAKPFACEDSWYRSNKLSGLMATVGASNHLLPENAPARGLDGLLGEPLDPSIFERIDHLRHRSGEYLDASLARLQDQ